LIFGNQARKGPLAKGKRVARVIARVFFLPVGATVIKARSAQDILKKPNDADIL
jgi:hypothetical protein